MGFYLEEEQNGGIGGIYPATYVNTTVVALPATGVAYAPDGVNLVDQDTVLFTKFTILSGVGGRGIYRATVVLGKVTAWTKVVYGQSPIGDSIDGDIVVITAGVVYDDHKFQCTDTPLAIWVDLGVASPIGSYTHSFIVADWILDAPNNEYYLDIVHNLNSLYPVVDIRDASNIVVNVNEIITLNANTLRLKVPAFPDKRFIGTISVIET